MSALGQKQTYALQQPVSALPPIATAKTDMPQLVMSASPPESRHVRCNVRYGPKADSDALAGTIFFAIGYNDVSHKSMA
jgi:hypothetical protein